MKDDWSLDLNGRDAYSFYFFYSFLDGMRILGRFLGWAERLLSHV